MRAALRASVGLGLGLMGCGPAQAGTLVLHGGDDGEAAVEAARERLLLPRSDFAPLAVRDLVEPALRVYGAPVVPCERGQTRLSDLSARVDLAAKNLDFGEYAAAGTSLSEAWEATRCLDEPLDPMLAHRLHFLRGVVAIGQEAEDAEVLAHFTLARQFAPRVPWDEDFFPRGRELYETAVPGDDAPTYALSLVGRSPESRAWLDGRPWTAPLTLTAGPHLVQVARGDRTHTALVALDRDTRVASPELDPAAVVAAVASDPAVLAALVGAALPGESAAYVAHGDGIFRLSLADTAVERVADPPIPPGRPWGPWAVAGGSAVTVGALSLGLPAFAQTHQSAASSAAFVRSAKTGTGDVSAVHDAYEFEQGQYDAAVGRVRIAAGIGAVGVGGIVAGALNWDAKRRERIRFSARQLAGGVELGATLSR